MGTGVTTGGKYFFIGGCKFVALPSQQTPLILHAHSSTRTARVFSGTVTTSATPSRRALAGHASSASSANSQARPSASFPTPSFPIAPSTCLTSRITLIALKITSLRRKAKSSEAVSIEPQSDSLGQTELPASPTSSGNDSPAPHRLKPSGKPCARPQVTSATFS